MNFACGTYQGGGAGRMLGDGANGRSVTQEENILALTPDAYRCISESGYLYPLYDKLRCLYIHDVNLMRNDDFTLSDTVYPYDMMVGAAMNMRSPFFKKEASQYTYKSLVDYYMRGVLHNMLLEAARSNVDVIILGPWGVGVFAPWNTTDCENYTRIVMEMMYDVCESFRYIFKKIVFTLPFDKKPRVNRCFTTFDFDRYILPNSVTCSRDIDTFSTTACCSSDDTFCDEDFM